MNEKAIELLLASVAEGSLPVASALDQLRTLPYVKTASALLDTHRELRQGMPEVVFARSKTSDQVLSALQTLSAAHGYALATSVSSEMATRLKSELLSGIYDQTSRLFKIGAMEKKQTSAIISVVCAGTSDLSVAEEAAQTLEFAGYEVRRLQDVGVAGLHRLLSKLDELRESRVIIAVAGMEGTLPGVLAGLVAQPVIAVPTSVGYGSNFGGLSALLAMLNSCSGGLGVVNIDNGFGAAVLAMRILQTDSGLFPKTSP